MKGIGISAMTATIFNVNISTPTITLVGTGASLNYLEPLDVRKAGEMSIVFSINMAYKVFPSDYIFISDRKMAEVLRKDGIYNVICPDIYNKGNFAYEYDRDKFKTSKTKHVDSAYNCVRLIKQIVKCETLLLYGFDYYVDEGQHFYENGAYEITTEEPNAFRDRLDKYCALVKEELESAPFRVVQMNPDSRLQF